MREYADLLVTAEGQINVDIIPFIRFSNSYQTLSAFEKGYADFVFRELEKGSSICERLHLARAPKPNSFQASLIRHSLDIREHRPLKDREAQKTVLMALLSLSRQKGNARTCFSTAFGINQSWSSEGIQQIFEDYLSIMNVGYLARATNVSNHQVVKDLPVLFDENSFREYLVEDNWLMRCREYTIASFGTNQERCRKMAVERFSTALESSSFTDRQIIALEDEFESSIYFQYMGFASNNQDLGAWVMHDVNSNRPITDSRASWEEFFLSVLERAKKNHPEYSFSGQWFLTSEEFIKKMVEIPIDQPLNVFGNGVNRPAAGLFVQYVGGNTNSLLENYYGQPVIEACLPSGVTLLERIVKFIQQLPADEQKRIEANSEARYLFHNIGHAMNLQVGIIAKAIKEAGTSQAFLKQHEEISYNLLNTVLSVEQKKEFLTRCVEFGLTVNEKLLKEPLSDKFSDLCKWIVDQNMTITENQFTYVPGKIRIGHIRNKTIALLERAAVNCSSLGHLWKQHILIDLNYSGDIAHRYVHSNLIFNVDSLFEKELMRHQDYFFTRWGFESGPYLSVLHPPTQSALTRMYYQTK